MRHPEIKVVRHRYVTSEDIEPDISQFTFRSNHREKQNAMFDLLIASV